MPHCKLYKSLEILRTMSTSRIAELAQKIASQTTIIDEHLSRSKLTAPSFEVGAPTEPVLQANDTIEKARIGVVEATIELRQLLEGPVKLLLPEVLLPNLHLPLLNSLIEV